MILNLLLILYTLFHPFYVSVTEIKHNTSSKQLEVSVRVFFDDFEKALEKKAKTNVNILKPADRQEMNKRIADYINTHLIIQANGKQVNLKFIGYEIEEDAAWCYFESSKMEDIKEIKIMNDILFNEHPTQTNMLHVIVAGKRKSTKLDNPQSTAVFKY